MNCDFIAQATQGVQGLKPYLPGKPAEELERELGLTNVVKLASNENPLGTASSVIKAVQPHVGSSHLYPDSGGYNLKRALSTALEITPEMITLGNGSNDVLDLLGRAFINAGDEVIYSEYAFVVYSIVTQSLGGKAVVTPSKAWGHDLDAMLAAVSEKTRMVYIANPNNPTGTWLSSDALTEFMQNIPERVIVVLDEAYTEYVSEPAFANGLKLQKLFPNLVVTRTFSKAYGLAGLRVGFSVSSTEIADLLSRVRQPFNVNSLALIAAETVLQDKAYLEKTVEVNTEGMAQMMRGLGTLGLEYIPSVANFITVNMQRNAGDVYQALLQEGVIVRPVTNYSMPNHLRISIGLNVDNERCLEALKHVVEAQ